MNKQHEVIDDKKAVKGMPCAKKCMQPLDLDVQRCNYLKIRMLSIANVSVNEYFANPQLPPWPFQRTKSLAPATPGLGW
jgi:hypothetical protein